MVFKIKFMTRSASNGFKDEFVFPKKDLRLIFIFKGDLQTLLPKIFNGEVGFMWRKGRLQMPKI